MGYEDDAALMADCKHRYIGKDAGAACPMCHRVHAVKLTPAQLDALNSLAWGGFHFGSLLTGRHTPRRIVMALCRKGLAKSQGLVEQCDGDGFIVYGRTMREGFRLTSLGVEVAVLRGSYYGEKLQQQKGLDG